MTNTVALLFVMLSSVVKHSDAVSCYNCQYIDLLSEEATCDEPFNASGAPTCNGTACEFIFQNITSNYYAISRNCTSQLVVPVDQCLMYGELSKQYNYTFFTYGNSCCFSYSDYTQEGLAYEVIACQCQTDNCNGDLPHKIPNAGDLKSTTADRIPSAGDLQSTTTNRIPSAGDLQSTTTNRISSAGDLKSTTTNRISSAGDLTSTTTNRISSAGDLKSTTTNRIPSAGDLKSTTTNRISNAGNLQSTTTNIILSAGDVKSTTTNRIPSAGFSLKPISKLPIGLIAMIAVLFLLKSVGVTSECDD